MMQGTPLPPEKSQKKSCTYSSCPRKYPFKRELWSWNGPSTQEMVSWVKAERVGVFASHCWTKDRNLCLRIDPEDLNTWKEGIFHCLQKEKFWKKGLMPNIFLSLVCQKGSGKCLYKNSSCLHIFTNLFGRQFLQTASWVVLGTWDILLENTTCFCCCRRW